MRSRNILSAVALLAAPAISLPDDYNMNMPCNNDICWTSWKCHYSRYSKYDDKIGNRCGLPDNVYTPGPDGANWNTLVWGKNYWMEWTSSYESQGEDIVLEWLMFSAPGTEKPIPANETDMYIDYRGKGPERFVVAHSQSKYTRAPPPPTAPLIPSTDISKATVGWYFQPDRNFFPNAHLNVSSIEVTGYAMERNVFRLYHPKTFNPHNATTWDLTEPFSVIRPEEERMIKKAKANQSKSDNKKLALGVGLGVGLAWFVAFLVSWYTSAWNERRKMKNKGVQLE